MDCGWRPILRPNRSTAYGSLSRALMSAWIFTPFGWAIEMYIPTKAWPAVLPIVEKLSVPVVFDHMGGMMADTPHDDPVFRRILALLEGGRCWTKLTGYRPSIAGPPYADVAPLARRFIEHGLDRCVWGSDWPHTNLEGYMPDDGDLLDLLGDWAPDPANPLPKFNPPRRVPHGITLIGRLFDEGILGRVGVALEKQLGVMRETPPKF